ncbi:hypothetical protein BGZ95_010168 [Linnemannia exigua]|uniref:Uncharacterized protein n=1 Tax=Linnemannia exigua TaxID=604196 RepID=A0AAD4H667_9FUNG|nr:hypothetical protein BGZ95_010168 [Linnemannia exigua]
MSISIDTQEGGPIEGIFGSQVEQRLAHHIDHDDDDFDHARRPSESGRDSMQSNTDLRGHSPSPYRLTAPSPRPSGSKRWLRLPWNPWKHESLAMPHAHRTTSLPSPLPKHNNSPWWRPSGVYDRLPFGMSPNRAVGGGGGNPGQLRRIQDYIAGLVAAVVSSNRRKGWFLGLILVSLALTFFSGGYLMSQLQHHSKEIVPPVVAPSTADEQGARQPITPIVEVEQDSGPRKDRDRSKSPHGPKKTKPAKPTEGNRDQDAAAASLRICNLADVAKGQWVFSQVASTHSSAPAAGIDQDLSWTGYGPSNIWNERYLLTPAFVPETESPSTTSSPHLSSDWAYADRLQQYRWVMEHTSPNNKQKAPKVEQQEPKCRQPDMDLADFVEVLKRAPLVMIGDKFLEQEFLILECMFAGMQQQLLIDYRAEDNGNRGLQEELEALDYWIDSEKPAIIELKVASGEELSTSKTSSEGTGEAHRPRSIVYRKAKPGQMRLFDRQSNLTLITFIRSDVLWDAGMMTEIATKHAITSLQELSTLDAGGVHPDCKLAGSSLMCEPAGIDRHDSESRGITQQMQQSTSGWWTWLVGSQEESVDELVGHNVAESTDEEMSTGSDLDHDMINLEWVETLKEIVQESASLRQKRKWGAPEVERKPMVVVSNGQFWEYDPRDAVRLDLQGDRKLSKVEQDKIKESQDKRRVLLRQRYTIVLTNMLDYIKSTYPDLPVIVQTSVKRSPCDTGAVSADEKALWKLKDQEAALLNALTKTVVARMQDPLYSFLDTTFLRLFKDSTPNKRHCRNFMMPGPLDTLVKFLYGELFRLDL